MTQDGSQDRLKMASRRSQDGPEECFFALENRLRFCIVLGSIFVPFWLPKCLPFGTLLALKINQKVDPKSDCLKGRSKNAPRAPKTLPRRPPDPPGHPQVPPRRLPNPPRTPPDALTDPSGRPKMLFRTIWPNNLFRTNRKIRNRRKSVERKVDNGHPRWSLASVAHKNRKHFHNGRNPEGGGGGRAKRSSIRRPRPQASSACCEPPVETFFQKLSSSCT